MLRNSKRLVKISVIIPVYNVEKYLRQCLNSVINQTLNDIEVICVNDGSTDNSLDILKQYAANDFRIKVLNRRHKGAGAARNYGLKIAQGEYIIFLDSDDFFEHSMLEEMYSKAKEDYSDIVVCGYTIYDSILQQTDTVRALSTKLLSSSPIMPREFSDDLFSLCFTNAWTKLFKHDIFTKNKLYFEKLEKCNDLTCVICAMALANKISLIDKPFIYYRWNTEEQTSSTRFGKNDSFIYAVKKLEKKLHKLDLYDAFYKKMRYAVAKCLFWETKGNINLLRDLAQKKLSQKLYHDLFSGQEELKKIKGTIMVKQNVEKKSRSIKLFFIFPIYSCIYKGGRTVWSILGLPIFKRRKMANGVTTKYYILGIPVMKISRKTVKCGM